MLGRTVCSRLAVHFAVMVRLEPSLKKVLAPDQNPWNHGSV